MNEKFILSADTNARLGRVIQQAMLEILGPATAEALFKQAGLADSANGRFLEGVAASVGRFMEILENDYGDCSGHGLALRLGRAGFSYGLREFGPALGLSEPALRLLPAEARIAETLQRLAQAFSKPGGLQMHFEQRSEGYVYRLEQCPVCHGRHTETPACYLIVGVFQEALYWMSGGKYYPVVETACQARGAAACVIEIARQPFE